MNSWLTKFLKFILGFDLDEFFPPFEGGAPSDPSFTQESTVHKTSEEFEDNSAKYEEPRSNKKMHTGPKFHMPKFRYIGFLLLVVVISAGLFSSFYSVDQTEYVILTTFGVPSSEIQTPGLRFKLPFGIQQVIRIPKRTFSTTLGYAESSGQTNINSHNINEKESKMITGDENIILADMEVQWRIVDPIAFYYNNDVPQKVIYNAISSSLRSVIGSSTVDEALTDGRNKIIDKIRHELVKLVDQYGLGVSIINVNLQDVDLPNPEVDKAFKSVTNAREERITKINEANKYRNEKINELIGRESAIRDRAEGEKTVLIERAKGDVAQFNALYEEYVKNPLVTKKDLIINALKEIYANAKIIITGPGTFQHFSMDQLLKSSTQSGGIQP